MEKHIPVLVQEVLKQLDVKPDNTVLDGTIGPGGHAGHIIGAMRGGIFVGVDADSEALTEARKNLTPLLPRGLAVHFAEGNFRDIAVISAGLGIDGYDRVLLDLGWGSHHLKSGRGFSFMHDEPLNMCYGTKEGACTVTAAEVVNEFEEKNLADIIRGYGGERWAVRIAGHIADARKQSRITTTRQLADIVAGAIPRRLHPKNIHPATRTFQAIRITVNDELTALRQFLGTLPDLLRPSARVAIIAFHSSEDRIVKRTHRMWEQEGMGKRYTKKAQKPTAEECAQNPRAGSATLRTFIFNK